MAIGVLLTMGNIVNKNSRAAGELSATVKNFGETVKEFKDSVNASIEELFDSRLKHEREITALKTSINRCPSCNEHIHHRLEDEDSGD